MIRGFKQVPYRILEFCYFLSFFISLRISFYVLSILRCTFFTSSVGGNSFALIFFNWQIGLLSLGGSLGGYGFLIKPAMNLTYKL